MVFVFLPTTLYFIIVLRMDLIGRVMLYIRAVAMFVPTVICFPICYHNIMFFATHFALQNKGKDRMMHNLLLFWALLMWALKLIHALSMTFVATLHFEFNHPENDHIESEGMYFAYLLLVRTYCYVIDFLNMVSLLYLFYR